MSELNLHDDPDAARWAREFCKIWPKVNPGQPCPDEGWMLGWFANAMTTMHDVTVRKYTKETTDNATTT